MNIEQLRIAGLRCFEEVAIELDPGMNLFTGANGAGKTSVLEAVFLLSHGRSFRSGAKDALARRGCSALSVFAELRRGDGRSVRSGLGRSGSRWEARIDGATVPLGQLVQECAVVCFDPGSHALISGGAEERRRYLDWGVFHVEQDFLTCWRRYQRALKQRNSLLRTTPVTADALYAPWEVELAQTAQQIDNLREAYLGLLRPLLVQSTSALLGELGGMELRYRRGWMDHVDLADQLREQRARDVGRGHTTAGAHRADWTLAFECAPLREHLSRGQGKLAALACMLAQAQLYAAHHGEWPIVCLDDLASELDQAHQRSVIAQLTEAKAQILLTGTESPLAMEGIPARMFHVEQGQLSRLL
ncbi:DNA replication/repair protein RecF [Rhodanobacter sp. AS-Z3]|uniref:DNA replication/repair protein RecF n=1 Tax=Rhodanobacter sp. AS-Z3 TaxID=3031330 RepID=UPI00247ABA87|nr:DNA replication/repair protein RecF [Rhodanobacter sp. AS-Z3]WEN15511.1 DNA replication/repair protein RecF [Rhodanobacter sp. AS-Z3]